MRTVAPATATAGDTTIRLGVSGLLEVSGAWLTTLRRVPGLNRSPRRRSMSAVLGRASGFGTGNVDGSWAAESSFTSAIVGTGLGVVATDVTVVYSNAFTQSRPRTYAAVGCAIVAPNTQLRCLSSVGVGKEYVFRVTVGGGAAANWSSLDAALSYFPPVIESFSGYGFLAASTAGGELVNITGSGFGSIEDNGKCRCHNVDVVGAGVGTVHRLFCALRCPLSPERTVWCL